MDDSESLSDVPSALEHARILELTGVVAAAGLALLPLLLLLPLTAVGGAEQGRSEETGLPGVESVEQGAVAEKL